MRRVLALCSLALALGCDRDGRSPAAPERLEAAASPSVVGGYSATFVGTITDQFGQSSTYTCPGTVDIPAQPDSTFSGSFTEQGSGGCQQESGTVAGTVRPDSSLTFTADLPRSLVRFRAARSPARGTASTTAGSAGSTSTSRFPRVGCKR